MPPELDKMSDEVSNGDLPTSISRQAFMKRLESSAITCTIRQERLVFSATCESIEMTGISVDERPAYCTCVRKTLGELDDKQIMAIMLNPEAKEIPAEEMMFGQCKSGVRWRFRK
jgi:hypothetical protein